jgi:DNA-binding SARP family transcriptional activator
VDRDTKEAAIPLRVKTLGGFRLWRDGEALGPHVWGREKALHLFQFLLTFRNQLSHKEQIIAQLWPASDSETGDRDFKVALNAVQRALEPGRAPRAPSRFIERIDLAYRLAPNTFALDADEFESQMTAGNRSVSEKPDAAIPHYRQAVALYAGDFLPERRYEDWTSAERERLQTLALSTMTRLANLLIETSPGEALQLCQRVLTLDPVWEDAYRAQMRAYQATGNRPLALRTYKQCQAVLAREFNVPPLPETTALFEEIKHLA